MVGEWGEERGSDICTAIGSGRGMEQKTSAVSMQTNIFYNHKKARH
jgi:hypothetical protein